MSQELLAKLIFFSGVGHLAILIASAMVPFRLNWREELAPLSKLHRQMYLVYGGYVVLSIVSFALISLFHAEELASGNGLARGFCWYVAIFWLIRLALQGVFDVNSYLTTWWLRLGYHGLTMMFLVFVIIFGCAALGVAK